jgi:hypothetical protein
MDWKHKQRVARGCYTFVLSIASWSHRNTNLTDDLFAVNDCPRRRHLPSWTWAGWNGPVGMQAPGEATGGPHGGFMTDLIEIKPTLKMMWAPDLTLRDENKTTF